MNISKFLLKTVSTFFYVGYLPLFPGTFASLAGLALFYLIKDNAALYILVTLLLLILGFLCSGKAEGLFKRKDASYIVIDEIPGMLLALMFIPYSLKSVMIGFALFRILDAFKPYPAGRLQELKGSLGIMSDDIVAGLYVNVILQIVLRLAAV